MPPLKPYRDPRHAARSGSNRPAYGAARPRYEPPRRDTFPIIMGAVLGMLIVAILVAVYLLLTRNTPSTVANNVANQASGNSSAAGQATSDPPTPLAMSQSGTSTGSSAAQQTMVANRPANGLGTPMPDEGNQHVN